MISVTLVNSIPRDVFEILTDLSAGDVGRFTEYTDVLEAKSCPIWQVSSKGRILCVGGLCKESLVSSPEIWVIVTRYMRAYHAKELLAYRALLFVEHSRVISRAAVTNTQFGKFATFFGFRPVRIEDKHVIYEAVR